MSTPRPRPTWNERLPLRLRLPNAPPIFVGRAREADALDAALRRAPVSCLWGPGGLGKSALTFHVLHARFPAQVPRTLVVRLAQAQPVEQALLTVARALAAVQQVSGIDWSALMDDRDALVAAALDLAEGTAVAAHRRTPARKREAQAYWIVIDDLHHAPAARAAEVLGQLAQYARFSRWIVVSRTRFTPGDAPGQDVALGPMAADELRALAERWGAPARIDEGLLAGAAGSPWRLAQLLRGSQPAAEARTDDLLDGLPAGAADLLTDLSLIEVELPEAVLSQITALPASEVLDALERRGMIERRPSGVQVHEVARGLIVARLDAAARRARRLAAAGALMALEPPAPLAWLEGLRLLVDEGEAAEAARALDERGASLLDAGHAQDLWRALERATAGELASWRLRCAVVAGDPAVLCDLPLPPSPSPADRMRWALSLHQQGRYEEAAAAGAEAQGAARAAGDPDVAFDAGRIVGRALLSLGRIDRGLAVFEAQAPPSPGKELLRDADVAGALAACGQRDRALERIQAVESRLAAHPGLGDGVLFYAIAWTLYRLGAVDRTERAIERLIASSRGVPIAGLSNARTLFLRFAVAFDRGKLAQAAELLDKLLPFASRGPVDALYVGLYRRMLRFERGQLAGLRAEVGELIASAARGSFTDLLHWARALDLRIALALGDPPAGPPLDLRPDRSPWEDHLLLWEIIHRACWGEATRDPEAVRSSVPMVRVLARLCRAWVAMAGPRDAGEAQRAAADASALAEESGYRLLDVLARAAAATACLLSGAPSEAVQSSAAALSSRARASGLEPLVVEAELLALCASPEAFTPARLEAIARAGASAPVAARRARALLGEAVALDRVDQAVIEAVIRRVGFRVVAIGDRAEAGAPGWGLDDRVQIAWLPDRTCALAEKPLLWRILRALADAGGVISKEDLVIRAWEQRDYHPLRDDTRLYTAIRTLRRLIEDDPANPSRLVTTKDGYAFGSGAPVRRVVPA